MPFDIEGAKKAGYSESEIVDYLAKQNKFNVQDARKSGYTDKEILNHFSTKETLQQSSLQLQKEQGYLGKLISDLSARGSAIKQAATDVYEDKLPLDKLPLRIIGQAAQGATDIIGRTVEEVIPEWQRNLAKGAAKTAYNYTTPDFVKNTLSQSMEKGVKLYEWLSKNNPEQAQDLKDILNILTVAPVGKLPELGVKSATETTIGKTAGRIPTEEEIKAYTAQKARQVREAEIKSATETKKINEELGIQPINYTFEKILGKFFGSSGLLDKIQRENFRKIANQYENMLVMNISPEKINQFEERTKNMMTDYLKSKGITNNETLNAMRSEVGNAFAVIGKSNIPNKTVAQELGMNLQEKVETNSTEAHTKTKKQYDIIKEKFEGKILQTPESTKTAETLLENLANNPVAQETGILKDLNLFLSRSGELEKILPNLKPEVRTEFLNKSGRTWEELNDLAHSYYTKMEGTAVVKGTGIAGAAEGEALPRRVYSQMIKAIRQDQMSAAEKENVAEWLNEAKKLHIYEDKTFRNKTIIQSVRNDPEKFFTNLKNSTDLDEIKATLREKDFDKYFKPYVTHYILTSGETIPREGEKFIFNPKAVIKKLNDIGSGNLSKIYTYDELNTIKQVAFKGINFTKTIAEGEEQKFLEKAIKVTSPDTILNMLFRENNITVHKNIEMLDNLFKTSGDKEGQQILRDRLVKEIFTKEQSLNLEGKLETFSGAKMKNQLLMYNDALKKLISPVQYKLINDISKATMELRGGEEIGGKSTRMSSYYWMHQFGTLGFGIIGAAVGHPIAGAVAGAANVSLPYIITKLYTSSSGRALLRKGLQGIETAGEAINWSKQVAEKLPTEAKASLLKSLAAYEVQNQQDQQEINQ